MASNNADPPQLTIARGASSLVPADVRFATVRRNIVKLRSLADLSSCLENSTYYVPEDPAFPLFYAFTIDLDHSKKSAILWVLQMTTSRLDGGSVMGYQKIRNIIATLKDKLGEDPPPKKTTKVVAGQATSKPLVKVCYLLVVPKGNSQNLQWHFPKGWSQSRERNDHRGGVYCLEVHLTPPVASSVTPLSMIY